MVKMMKKGFTLVELMVVIVIIGVLAAVAIPKFMQASLKAKASEFPTILTNISTLQAGVKTETGTYEKTFANIGDKADQDQMAASKWFNYDCATANNDLEFKATAAVDGNSLGAEYAGAEAYIDHTGAKTKKAGASAEIAGATGLVKTWQ